jgi:hypothetical protein
MNATAENGKENKAQELRDRRLGHVGVIIGALMTVGSLVNLWSEVASDLRKGELTLRSIISSIVPLVVAYAVLRCGVNMTRRKA